MPSQLEMEFHAAMVRIARRASDEANYHAIRFNQMLGEHGGLDTAKILINAERPSEGYTHLWERGRLDLTVEALVQDPKWHPLFEPAEIQRARERLAQYEYQPAAGETPRLIEPLPDTTSAKRNWVGNDQSQRNVNGIVQLDETPLTLRLSWVRQPEDTPCLIGVYSLDLVGLRDRRYILADPSGPAALRLRFFHDEHDVIHIGHAQEQSLPIGHFRAN